MLYCAIIGDIINSKKITDRNRIQDDLKSVLVEVNDKYRSHIASSFTVTLGDEFQGLLHSAAEAFDIIEFIQRKMFPIRFRFGIGLDDISTQINPDISIGADGPAFYNARNMIENVKSSKKSNWYSYQPEIFFKSHGCDDGLINAVAVLYRHLERGWSESQRKYIYCYFDETENQYEIAKIFNVSQSNINQAFERADLYKYLYALEQLKEYFIKNNF